MLNANCLAVAIDWTIRVEYLKARDAVWQVIQDVEDLFTDIGLPKQLSEVNAKLDDPAAVVDEAYNSFLNQVNPRPASKEVIEGIISEIT